MRGWITNFISKNKSRKRRFKRGVATDGGISGHKEGGCSNGFRVLFKGGGFVLGEARQLLWGSKSDTEICIYPLLLICLRYFNGLTRGAL